MPTDALPDLNDPAPRDATYVVIAASGGEEALADAAAAVRARSPEAVEVVTVAATAAGVNEALRRASRADAAVLLETCEVPEGWLTRLRAAARADTNTATASALADVGTALACGADGASARVAERTLRVRPRISRAVGPCVYLRRDALDLAGELDEGLDLWDALEVDFAQRCLLSGLAHVAADDVAVVRPSGAPARPDRPVQGALAERYPYLAEMPFAQSNALEPALRAVRGVPATLDVTLDARALHGSMTGTQVHIFELIGALARTGSLRLRLLLWRERIEEATVERLRALPGVELLFVEDVTAGTRRSTVFHRPQQAFSADDVGYALALGERVVVSQLDLIAYRNPGYFADTGAWEDYRRASRHGLVAAERVVVFSEHTRAELASDELLDPARIRVVPPGLDHTGEPEQRRPAGLDAVAGPSANGFLLCLGTDFRHKNRAFALRLLDALRSEHGFTGALVLAGAHLERGSSSAEEATYLREHPDTAGSVVDLGAVAEEEKAWLLANALAVLYPSVYEGFGLVPFESALHGVPCVFAAQSSLAEVAPEGTALVVPWDVALTAAAVSDLLADPAARARNVEQLAAEARRLTWGLCAERMVEVYREAASAPAREGAALARDAAARERTLMAAHLEVVEELIAERERVRADYEELKEQVGPGHALVGPSGRLPEDLQRMLLAIGERPRLAGALFAPAARAFALLRAANRAITGGLRRRRG